MARGRGESQEEILLSWPVTSCGGGKGRLRDAGSLAFFLFSLERAFSHEVVKGGAVSNKKESSFSAFFAFGARGVGGNGVGGHGVDAQGVGAHGVGAHGVGARSDVPCGIDVNGVGGGSVDALRVSASGVGTHGVCVRGNVIWGVGSRSVGAPSNR